MKHFNRLLALEIVAAGLVAGIFSGCTRRETIVERGDREEILHRSLGYEVVSLDPQLAAGIAEQDVASALFEGLLSEDPHDLHPVPGVAARWEGSPDGLAYTFWLRPDARWSDGRPVTAQDFLAAWHRMLTPSLGAENAEMLYALRGGEAFHRGQIRDFSKVGAIALDARTLRVALAHPIPNFLSRLTHPAWFPIPIWAVSAGGPVYSRGNSWAAAGRLVGNGAFVLKSWQVDHAIVVEKSPTYWDAAQVRLRAIDFYPIDSVEAEERAFRAGQLHITDALPIEKIDAYRRETPQFLRTDPYLGTYFYRLNTRRPPLDDRRIRRALSLAVDRATIVEKILRGGQTEARAFTPPGLGGYAPPPGQPTDFAQARRLLAQAGHAEGRGLPPLELLYNNSENHRAIAEAIQEMWRRELGLDARLANQELKVVLAARHTGDFEIVRSAWIADYADPESFLDVWRSDNGNNDTGWANKNYDALLDEAARSADPIFRRSLWRQAEQLLLDEAPIIPIYHYTHVFLIQPSVHGWYPTPLDHHPYKYVWLGIPAP